MNTEIKEKLALGVFVFSILAIIVLVLFASPSNLTGKVIDDGTNVIAQTTCSDSDGKDYNIKGNVEYCTDGNCLTERDSCSGKSVVELYCEGNEKKSEEKGCLYDCDDGKCIEKAGDYKIIGSGGGNDGGSTSTPATTAAASGNNYNIGDLTSEQTLEIVKNDKIIFRISGNEYYLNLKDNSETQVSLLYNVGIETIDVGEKEEIDLDGNGSKDISVKVKTISVVSGKVKLILNLV